MYKYSQLSLEQRYQIEALYKAGKTQSEIGRLLGVHRSTISREFRRNIPSRGITAKEYIANRAQERTDVRHQIKRKRIRFSSGLKDQARRWIIEEKLSPELVSARFSQTDLSISTETIYQWIWQSKWSNRREHKIDKYLYTHLKHGKRRRKRGAYRQNRGLIPQRNSIENRPKIVEKRTRIGDLEIDLMMGKRHKASLLVILDRATLYTFITKVNSRSMAEISSKLKEKLRPCRSWIKTLTFDNDPAFFGHVGVGEELMAKTYFTRPYTSQDKGSVENRIGILRRFFPKKTALEDIPDQQIAKVQQILNNRPVRKFNYKTPNQIFSQKLGVALIS